MTIKAICFDADGVIVNPQMQFSQYLNTVHGITPQMTAPFFSGIFNECLCGQKDLRAVLPHFLEQWAWRLGVDEFIQTWMVKDHIIDEAVMNKIGLLRRQGYVCCLTTNQEKIRAAYMKEQMGFRDAFDQLFFSCEMGCQKPEDEYYQIVETQLAMETNEILFWDDSKKNVLAAKARGWHAAAYKDYADFETQLALYLAY